MNLTYIKSDDYNDYFIFTDDDGEEYPWHTRKGNFENLRVDEIHRLVRKKEYPELPIDDFETSGDVELWIDDNPDTEKVEWQSTHPKESDVYDRCKPSESTITEFDNAETLEDLKAVLKKLLIK